MKETTTISRSSRDSLVPKQARQHVSEIKPKVSEPAIADEDDSLYPGLVDDYVCDFANNFVDVEILFWRQLFLPHFF